MSWNVQGPAGAQGTSGATGPTGAPGAVGPAGAPGISNFMIHESIDILSPIPPNTVLSIGRSCPNGLSVLSGGISGPPAMIINESIPGTNGASWSFLILNDGETELSPAAIDIRLVCASVTSSP